MLLLRNLPPIIITFFVFSSPLIAQKSDSEKNIGWLKIEVNAPSFFLIIDEDFENHFSIFSRDSVELTTGKHQFRIVGERINDVTGDVIIKENETTTRRFFSSFSNNPKTSYQIIQQGSNVNIATEKGGLIFVDGEYIDTSNTELLLSPGKHSLEITHPELGSLSTKFKVAEYKTTNIARFNADPTPNPTILKILPAVGYFSNQQYTKGIITLSSLSAIGISLFVLNNKYDSELSQYKNLTQKYRMATTTQEAVYFRRLAEATIVDLDRINKQMNWLLTGASVIYVYTTIRGFLKPKEGYAGRINALPKIEFSTLNYSQSTFVQLNWDIQLK